ncbi:prepilin peptidase [Brevibacillus sp. SYSU BS000544]|uniref:prepilin peptidase n=1 Tax=Brevibacillus sp. SYSU BS000544 TaxID=3416443 RepID=UPI003CE513A0
MSEIPVLSLIFLLGLLFGSFYNVVGLRVPKGESIIQPPSHCPGCQQKLSACDLIPVLSYLLAKGKCRSCQMTISPIYPVMELFTGIFFALTYWRFDYSTETLVGLGFVSLLVIITVSDLKYRLIPDKVVFPFLGLFLVARFFIHPTQTYWMHLLAMAIGFGLFLLIAIVTRGEGMGGGDIKLFAVIGLVLGVKLLFVSIFLSSLLGALVGILLILLKKANRKSSIPFGPFIAVGSLLAYLYGEAITTWYVALLF